MGVGPSRGGMGVMCPRWRSCGPEFELISRYSSQMGRKVTMRVLIWAVGIGTVAPINVRAQEPARSAEKVEVGKAFENGPGMQMIWVKPGKFKMGSPPTEAGRGHGEDQVDVEITKGFWLAATEVTRAQWAAVLKPERAGRGGAGPAYPFQVGADKAIDYCRQLTRFERKAGRIPDGYAYQLPTEAQWEYACRAGTKGSFAGEPREIAWFGMRGPSVLDEPMPVAKRKPNPWGFYDMHGNVEEWCADWFDIKLQGGKDPLGPAAGKGEGLWYAPEQRGRVLRGGNIGSSESRCRSAARLRWLPAAFRYSCWGFRVALRPTMNASE